MNWKAPSELEELSMSDKTLQKIQTLQFTDREAANELLRKFISSCLPLKVESVNIRPLAVSLNSINGILTTEDNEKLFFKTHIEPQSIINEYYNSLILAEAGYPVLRPVLSSTEWGKQMLVYEFTDFPSLFDVIRGLETSNGLDAERIIAIQQQADAKLWEIYFKTLQFSQEKAHATAPIHQLFHHRLTAGRFTHFYRGTEIILPGQPINFERLEKMKWIINGVRYKDTLGYLIQLAIMILDPSRFDTPLIIGHGDAHNGNIFMDKEHSALIYFDPAFAGRHSPLLDLVKPLFHNTFAIWMYFPQEIAKVLSTQLVIQDNTFIVEHNFAPSEIRLALFQSKINLVLKPLLRELKSRGWLFPYWQEYLKSALLCCSLLTMNLSDTEKFSPEIALLGLATSIEMGSTGKGATKSLLDFELDKLADEL
jgi:hypothetical protein